MTTTAHADTTYWGTLYYVTHKGREYTVSSVDANAPYTQVLLHAERKAPAGTLSPRGHAIDTYRYCRKVNPKGKLGRLLIAAAKTAEVV